MCPFATTDLRAARRSQNLVFETDLAFGFQMWACLILIDLVILLNRTADHDAG